MDVATAHAAPTPSASTPAFNKGLLVLHTVGLLGLTEWHYAARKALVRTTLRDAMRPGFFDPAADRLQAGHMILVTAWDGAAQLYVLASDGERVTLAPMCWTGTIPHPPTTIATEAPHAGSD